MLSLPDARSIRVALHQPLNPKLHTILTHTLVTAEANGLEDQTFILVIEPGDAEELIEHELGWSPSSNPLDGARFGTATFQPYWSWLQDLGGWYELIHPVGNGGFAYIILMEDAPGVPADLLRMCRHYLGEGG